MSSDRRGFHQRPAAQAQVGHQANESPFMQTAFGYSAPQQVRGTPPPQNKKQLPPLSGYQQEIKSTPTSVLLPAQSVTEQRRGKLVTIRGEQAGESWFLNRSVTSLGRALDNDIVLLDIAASRKHAQVLRGEQGFSLLDLRSANGIFLNGRRVTEEELYDGDEIEIGETVLRFESLGEARERLIFDDDTSPGSEPIIPHTPVFKATSIPLPPQSHQYPQQPRAATIEQHQEGAQVAKRTAPASQPMLRRQANKQMHVTYGFGSQWSQEDLGISPNDHRLEQAAELSLGAKVSDLLYRARTELWFGQGRTANILRSSLALLVLLTFFGLGHLIKRVTRSLTESSRASISSPLAISAQGDQAQGQSSPEQQALKVKSDQLNHEIEALISRRAWNEALEHLSPDGETNKYLNSARFEALRTQVERGLIEERLPEIRSAIYKGRLKRAEEDHQVLIKKLSPQGLTQVIPVSFALWLHRRELGDLSVYNPPPREQRSFERAAQETLRGGYRSALKSLKRTRVSKRRKDLLRLRQESIKVSSKLDDREGGGIREQELLHLLGDPFDIQRLLQRYRGEIEQGVRKTQYREIAPWLEAAIILSVDQPQVHQYFKSTQAKLQTEAKRWVEIARDEERQKNYSLARALLQAAIPYLQGNDVQNAERDLRRLKRRR